MPQHQEQLGMHENDQNKNYAQLKELSENVSCFQLRPLVHQLAHVNVGPLVDGVPHVQVGDLGDQEHVKKYFLICCKPNILGYIAQVFDVFFPCMRSPGPWRLTHPQFFKIAPIFESFFNDCDTTKLLLKEVYIIQYGIGLVYQCFQILLSVKIF